jgi:hypothetical protein
MSNDYEKQLEAANERLTEEIGNLREILSNIGPIMLDFVDVVEKDVNAIYNGYYEPKTACMNLNVKVSKYKQRIKEQLCSK